MQDRAPDPTPPVDPALVNQQRAVNYLLDGKDNFEADREATDASNDPKLLRRMARAHVQFRRRAVRFMAEQAGVRQFLNFDGGFPHALDLHIVAQQVEPSSHVVYVGADPVVAAHSRALLTSEPEGAVVFVDGEAARMAELLASPTLLATLDLARPLGITLSSSLMRMSDAQALAQLRVLRAAVPPGSAIALSQLTADFGPDEIAPTLASLHAMGASHPERDRERLTALFEGWEVVEPGIGSILDWRPAARDATADEDGGTRPHEVHVLGGVALLP
jgi:hypothetical protein